MAGRLATVGLVSFFFLQSVHDVSVCLCVCVCPESFCNALNRWVLHLFFLARKDHIENIINIFESRLSALD